MGLLVVGGIVSILRNDPAMLQALSAVSSLVGLVAAAWNVYNLSRKLELSVFNWLSGTITKLAVWLAGRRRASDHDAWRDHLDGHRVPSAGPLRGRTRVAAALGFVWAAVRFRARDLLSMLAQWIDWAVSRDERVASLTVLSVVVPCCWCYLMGGWSQVWDDLQSTGVVATFVGVGLLFWRKMRGIVLPPKRSTRNDSHNQR